MKGIFPTGKFKNLQTPFYFYDTELLRETIRTAVAEAAKYNYHIHYAVKANANPQILGIIRESGLGADCVSGGEIQAALNAGFPADKIVFAGVGKADREINLGLDNDIFCFNAESIPELEVINELAESKGKTARVALRINPEVDAHTHHHITTGTKENKFGINLDQLDAVLDTLQSLASVRLIGLHFHIGSQLTEMEPFRMLCSRVNELQQKLADRNIRVEHINFGGGLGIDYDHPDEQLIPDFKEYFELFHTHFPAYPDQQIHFEPGRSIVGQCGSLISKVLYVKEGSVKKFVILDAGFTELIRPALYDAHHEIENLSSEEPGEIYDVVGPICESSDCFAKQIELNKTDRGDLIAIRSAGAYGEIMASQYNCRRLPEAYFSDLL
ncbi:diaminopimelate decarboxylase [Bacteroidia bacterium]|nr:diaminopimelate decarboxylase [Bacteroidia bacterium]GHT04268.1 diaminopimelate decarboxylase [Bacteroidia bacterium]GHT51399.1 diaminopimelate decarboxylase [Bacteroidia bacterium]